MNGFRCNITGSTSNVPLAKAQVPRRCGADPADGKVDAVPGNCTYGAKQPFYWFQKEDNNVSLSMPPFGVIAIIDHLRSLNRVDVRGHLLTARIH